MFEYHLDTEDDVMEIAQERAARHWLALAAQIGVSLLFIALGVVLAVNAENVKDGLCGGGSILLGALGFLILAGFSRRGVTIEKNSNAVSAWTHLFFRKQTDLYALDSFDRIEIREEERTLNRFEKTCYVVQMMGADQIEVLVSTKHDRAAQSARRVGSFVNLPVEDLSASE